MPHGKTCNRRSRRPTFSSNRPTSWKTSAPALVVANLVGEDLILCQITSQSRRDSYSVPLGTNDFERGRLNVDSFIRANRLFTIDHFVIIYTAGVIKSAKLDEVRAKIRQLFS